jgi:hypothetical protein
MRLLTETRAVDAAAAMAGAGERRAVKIGVQRGAGKGASAGLAKGGQGALLAVVGLMRGEEDVGWEHLLRSRAAAAML